MGDDLPTVEATLINGDAIAELSKLGDNSIDMVLTDPPYGTTANPWDSVIVFADLWHELRRVVKPRGAVAMFGAQPFTSALVMSNVGAYKHHWIWKKTGGTGFQVAKYRPMMATEDIVVFAADGKTINYFPIMTEMDQPILYKNYGAKSKSGSNPCGKLRPLGERLVTHAFPTNVIEMSAPANGSRDHPSAKPVALMEYLIRTYSQGGDTVLDFTMGTGATGVAAKRALRNFVGIELDDKFFGLAQEKIQNTPYNDQLFAEAAHV